MTNHDFDELLFAVEKPSRYIGTELNTALKGKTEVNFLLAFPDAYEVGMSHLGLQILYSILNEISYVSAQRCFAPWPDREKLLRSRKLPLTSLEAQRPLADFDVIGFSLQYELSYTNVLNMLDLGRIPITCQNRKDGHPLVIAGGPCCFNPAPLVDFIDAFVIGEGEEIVTEITALVAKSKKQRLSRNEQIAGLAQIPGVYVPSIHKKNQLIKKRTVPDLNLWLHPIKPIVPLMQTVHDRIVLEIARGCTRGCRFCQAGMIWRPYRERNLSLLTEMAEKALRATGHDEISLLSLSSGDYSCIEPLIKNLMRKHYAQRVALALPSLRVESLTSALIEEIKRTRKTSFTLAPEAGTDKMRQIINKGNTSEDLLSSIDKVFAAGWKSIKLYFMLGLPHEEQEDMEGIVALGYQALRAAKNRGQVTMSLSTFVPKSHTPFQWEKQISLDETYIRQNLIRQQIKNRRLNVKWHDARMSMLEGIFSRGDEKLGALLEKAYQKGCRFDGWSEILRFDLWQEAITESDINPDNFLRARNLDEKLPWDNIDCGVSREFLIRERQNAQETLPTPDCRFSVCQTCGVCDFSITKNVFSVAENNQAFTPPDIISDAAAENAKNYRFAYNKFGRARFLSHLELSSSLIRALRRSNLSLIYSAGYHPHPKISFATATAVGMESRHEYMDVTAREYPGDLNSLKNEINATLPRGVEILEIEPLSTVAKVLAQVLHGFSYEIYLPSNADENRLKIINDNIGKFLASSSFNIERLSKGKTIIKDIRPFVESITFNRSKNTIEFTVRHTQEGSARPVDIITHVLGFSNEEAPYIYVTKIKTILLPDY